MASNGGPNPTVPPVRSLQKEGLKSQSVAPRNLATGKTGQAAGHKATVNKLSGQIPKK